MRTFFKNCLPSVIPNASRAVEVAGGIIRDGGVMIVTKSSHALCYAFLICLMLFAFAPFTIQAQDKAASVVNGSPARLVNKENNRTAENETDPELNSCHIVAKKKNITEEVVVHSLNLLLLGFFVGIICTFVFVCASNALNKYINDDNHNKEFCPMKRLPPCKQNKPCSRSPYCRPGCRAVR